MVHLNLTLNQKMWVQICTIKCGSNYTPYGVWAQLHTRLVHMYGPFQGKEITKLLLTVNCVFNHLVAISIYRCAICNIFLKICKYLFSVTISIEIASLIILIQNKDNEELKMALAKMWGNSSGSKEIKLAKHVWKGLLEF